MANHLRTELVLDALNMAIHNRRPAPGLVHHSDRGSQYTSVEFGGRLKEAGLLPSMGSVADAYDNALAESFISTLKRELLHRRSWPSREGVRAGGDLRVHRVLLQPKKKALFVGPAEPRRVRGG
ncbi:MAG: DDE-type integrase/transposase/recombinase [Rubrobacter sp.]|nr:DDE-type integrase/transposase/recombinase [Rubrobacter sp.]